MRNLFKVIFIALLSAGTSAWAGDGKIIGVIAEGNQIILKKNISDIVVDSNNQVVSVELTSGARIYSDEIGKILIEKADKSLWAKKILEADLHRVLSVLSGGDGSGGG
ncbi:MAG: hypothetical protein A2X86_21590 [Bdellovibrionales bacterium GWA2_49_15]|nr:MAG: hypothetical protein A2X86_21590 [Bdellovibrionales bacterium GWA2_49_15]